MTIEFVQLLQDMLGDLEGAPTPIEVKVFGDDQATLERLSDEIQPNFSWIACSTMSDAARFTG